MKELKTKEVKNVQLEKVASKPEAKDVPTSKGTTTEGSQPNSSQPVVKKKPKKGCCIGIAVIFIFLFLSSSGAFGFFDFLPWHGSSYDPSNFIPDFASKEAASVVPTATTKNQSSISSKPSTTGTSTTSNQSVATTEAPATTPADNVTTTTSQPGAGTQTPPATGAQIQTIFTRQEQIDFFVQIAMKNDQNNFATIPIQKWKTTAGTTAKIQYFNNPTGANLACADATILQINALSNTIHFSKTTGNDWKVAVYFKPKAEIGSGIGGYYDLSTDANHYITGGRAYVPSDVYNDVDRCHYIRHEMTHVMTGLVYNGLKNHGGYDFSIFNVSAGVSDFLEVDKSAIKIMLNSGVGLGWSESQVRNFLAGASW